MKVLILSNLYPSKLEPTRGTFNLNLFTELTKHCEVKLLAPVPWWGRVRRPGELFSAVSENHTGVEAEFPTYWSIPRVPSLHGRGLTASLRPHVARLHRTFPFDVILASWSYPDAYAAARLAQEYSCPVITKVLGSDINELARFPALRKQILWTMNASFRTIAVSEALRQNIISMGIPEDRVIAHHNGVNGDQFTIKDLYEVRSRLGLPHDRRLICYVGNFKPEKGVDVLVEAMGNLKQESQKDIELVMVGGGPMEDSLKNRARQLGIENRIHFVGRKLHNQIPDWIAACDVFCLPSRREGCPNVVLEGLASGRPVVASNVGGVPELINNLNGILTPSEDPVALAAGLQTAFDRDWNPEQLRTSVESLSWNALSLKLHDILEESIRSRKTYPAALSAPV